MTDTNNQSVEEQALQGQPQSQESELTHDAVVADAVADVPADTSDADKNWAEMRRQMREKDRQLDELASQFTEFKNRNPTPEEVDELSLMAEDDILTVAQAKKLALQTARAEADKVFKQRDAERVEDRLQMRYQDYKSVVTKENIELLIKKQPEIAGTLKDTVDPFKQGEAAYKLLLLAGIGPQAVNPDKEKARLNSAKPLSVNAASTASAVGQAHLYEGDLTPERKKAVWAQMQRDMRGG